MNEGLTVFLIDDDDQVRRSIERLLRSAGYNVRTFASAAEFLTRRTPEPGCLVLDVKMPKLSGLDLQDLLPARGIHLPVVFLSGHGDVPMTARAMKNGAVDFLTKPVRARDLLAAVEAALRKEGRDRTQLEEQKGLQARLATLTPREVEVFRKVVAGAPNKQIASDLGIAERTVKVHRARVMRKMDAASIADLARMAERVAPERKG